LHITRYDSWYNYLGEDVVRIPVPAAKIDEARQAVQTLRNAPVPARKQLMKLAFYGVALATVFFFLALAILK
jgi:hypothetical protein